MARVWCYPSWDMGAVPHVLYVLRAFTSNDFQCHAMSWVTWVLNLSLALRSLAVSAGTGLWTAFSNREVFVFVDDLKQTAREGKIHSTLVTTGHQCFSSRSADPTVVFELHLLKTLRKFIRTRSFTLFSFFILPPAVCDLSTCHRLHLGSLVLFKTLW